MGVSVSRQTDLSDNIYLKRFVGKTHIPINDIDFWNCLLQYHIALPSNSEEQLSLDSRLESFCQSFIGHNLTSGNFGSLITVFLSRVKDLIELPDKESSVHVWQAFNALFIIRCTIKYLIETGSTFQLLQHFEALPAWSALDKSKKSPQTDTQVAIEGEQDATTNSIRPVDGSKFESFFDAIVNLLVIIPVKEFTYHLHLESVNVLIVLMSVHLFSQQPAEQSTIYRTVFKNPNANTLMSALLHFVCRMVEVPQTMFGAQSGGSFVFGIAESLLSIFTFRRTQQDFASSNDLPTTFRDQYPLANQSLLLILILTNHCTAKNNQYRMSLFGCCDVKDSPKEGVTFKIDFSALFNTMCKIVTIDQATLLLYLLLHRSQRFYRFVMGQENLQQLVIPILQTLYNAPDSTSHHIYMTLIVLLILSEDDSFNKSVHQINLRNIQWYTERSISEISLGGLLILVVIRTIQYNMLKMRDKYLHTNCLAALANMSGQFRSLHPYVAQRLVSLFETLAKKHARLETDIKRLANGTVITLPPDVTGTENIIYAGEASMGVAVESVDRSMIVEDLTVLEEVLRMVLEILNSCISHQLVYCPNLVYTLLYKRDVFESFRSNPAFQDIIQNIDMVVGFFSSRLQRVQEQRGELSVDEVHEVISKGASQWSNDRLRKFPDLKFKYVEEDAPEEFFIPYVWTLVTKYGCVNFNSEVLKGVSTEVNC